MSKFRVLNPRWHLGQLRRVRHTLNNLEDYLEAQNVDPAVERITFNLSNITWEKWTGYSLNENQTPSTSPVLAGSIRQEQLLSKDFGIWMHKLRESPRFHNKQWQYFQLLQNAWTHFEGDFKGKKAIVFGVGTEPTVSLLASLGMTVFASDYFDGLDAEMWTSTSQMTTSLEKLNNRGICAPSIFKKSVSLTNMDMNQIPKEFSGQYDLVWSLCALGHIGGYGKGLNFILDSSRLLKDGGLAVHTTEMDQSPELPLQEEPGLSLYRLKDLENVLLKLKKKGFKIKEHDFSIGEGVLDIYIDPPPYLSHPHLRLYVRDHVVTPVSLVFSK